MPLLLRLLPLLPVCPLPLSPPPCRRVVKGGPEVSCCASLPEVHPPLCGVGVVVHHVALGPEAGRGKTQEINEGDGTSYGHMGVFRFTK